MFFPLVNEQNFYLFLVYFSPISFFETFIKKSYSYYL